MAVKYVFVTGGVVSGLGKGITAASLGRLLKARGYKVTMQKFDPYINIDPGTMNRSSMARYSSQKMVQRPIWIWDIMSVSSMRTWIRIPMSPPVKYTGPYYRRSAAATMAEVPYRSSPISPMRSRAAFTATLQMMRPASPSSRSAVP